MNIHNNKLLASCYQNLTLFSEGITYNQKLVILTVTRCVIC